MSSLEVGDHVDTPYGEAVVEGVDHRTQRFVTRDCETNLLLTWDDMEVEQLPPAPPERITGDGDGERLERWLRCKARIIPKLMVTDELVRCETGQGCECSFCYCIERTIQRHGDPVQHLTFTHMVDNTVMCHCEAGGCGCVAL